MRLKQLILGGLTVVAIAFTGFSLLNSWNRPQIQSRLELYQTNLILHAAEWQDQDADGSIATARNNLLGVNPVQTALEQYQQVRRSAQTNLEKVQTQLEPLRTKAATPDVTPSLKATSPAQTQQLKTSVAQLEQLINELDLRIGVLQVQQKQTGAALETWKNLIERADARSTSEPLAQTAAVLTGLWSQPSRLLPDAESQIQKQLDGWFRYRALSQLYQLQQRQDELTALQAAEQAVAQQSLTKLAIVVGIPGFACLIGIGLLLFLIGQRLVKGKQSLLANTEEVSWSTPWNVETILQVLVVGFFFVGQFLVGQLLVPILFGLLNINPTTLDVRTRALSILAIYLLIAAGGLLVLYLSVKPFLPLSKNWFRIDWRGNWFKWAIGGYVAALPLVILVSLINQQLWQGQGGSNPILSIALEGRDGVALALFFLTAAVAAPVFEEILFRGFLLPSLTRYMPVWGAIALSSLIFAMAHLSLSEVLPLATLGMILGFIYARSQNLLASMLLHSLWNSGTLLSLFILGSGSS